MKGILGLCLLYLVVMVAIQFCAPPALRIVQPVNECYSCHYKQTDIGFLAPPEALAEWQPCVMFSTTTPCRRPPSVPVCR